MYAVNIADLTKYRTNLYINMMLLPVLSRTKVEVDRSSMVDGVAALLECSNERAEAIISVLRQHVSPNDLRFYRRGPRGGWRRIR